MWTDFEFLSFWSTLQFSCSIMSDSLWSTFAAAAAAAKSLQSRPTLCNHIDGSPPGSPVPGILQARTLGWVAISFSNAWKWKVKVKSLSRVWLFATPWTAALEAAISEQEPEIVHTTVTLNSSKGNGLGLPEVKILTYSVHRYDKDRACEFGGLRWRSPP